MKTQYEQPEVQVNELETEFSIMSDMGKQDRTGEDFWND
jgi:hypothetical protein